VLYVEDEPVNVLLMEEIFRLRPKWNLIVASDGAEALQCATQERLDLVLVDMNLPDMHGVQLLEALREISPHAPVPCVALSASALCEQIDRASRAGFVEYWTKPIDVAGVMGGLTRVLAQTARPARADEAGVELVSPR
jgi:CheY-like chemotaxis protein